MNFKRVLSIMLCICLLMTFGPSLAFAGEGQFRALGNTETGILYGYSEAHDIKIVLENTTDTDVIITKIESTNAEDFISDLQSEITVPAGQRVDYPVYLATGKAAGTYEATYTFTDSNNMQYIATTKAIVEEKVVTSQQSLDPVVWDYEAPITATITIQNATSESLTLVKAESSSNDFEIKDISAEEDNISIASTKSAEYEVKLPTGKDVGTYSTTITFTDDEGQEYEQEVSVEVIKKELKVPAVIGEYTYNSKSQTLNLENFDAKYMWISLDYASGAQQSSVSAIKAGHYAPVVGLKSTKNCTWIVGEGEDAVKTTTNQTLSWDIAKYKLPKPYASDDEEFVYTGEEQVCPMESYTATLFGKDVLSMTGQVQTNAGTHTITITILDKVNFEWQDGTDADVTDTWTIKRAQVAEPQTVKTSFDYNSNAQSIEFAEDSINEDLMTVTGNSRTEIGTQTVTVTLKDKLNYEWESGNDTDLTFTLAIGTPVYSLPTIVGTYTYNGQTQHPDFTGFDSEHMTVTDNSGKDAGTYQVKISLKDKAHATWADTNTNEDRIISWTIQQAEIVVQAQDKTAKTGDTVPALNSNDYTITGVIQPDSLANLLSSYPTISYAQTPDMSIENTWDIIVSGPAASTDGNYFVTYKNAKLTVSASQTTDKLTDVEVSFDLPLAGCKDMSDGINNIAKNTSYVTVQFANGENGMIGVYDQATEEDITAAVAQNGLTEGAKVYLLVSLPTNSNKVIDKDVTKVTINGTVLSKDDMQLLADGEAVKVPFTVPAYRIHFKAAAGSGTMATQYAGSDKYTIPQCGFTAPSGYEFDKWQLEGDTSITYAPDEQVQLTSSINLVALYKEKTSSTGSSSGSTGGGGYIPGGGGGFIGGNPSEITKVDEVQQPNIIVDNGTTYVASKDGSAVTFTPSEGYFIVEVRVNGTSVGNEASVSGLKTGDTVECITLNKEGMQKILDSYQLAARSKMTKLYDGTKAVKIVWFDKNDKELIFDGVEIQRSTKRYSGYSKIFVSYTGKYYNTAIKAGNKYYYRVRGFVVFDGEKLYTPWSLKAWRTVK